MTSHLQKNLRTLLEREGLSATQAAKEAGFGESYLKGLLHDAGRSPRHDSLVRLADFFGVTVEQLLSPNLKTGSKGLPIDPTADGFETADGKVYVPVKVFDVSIHAGPGALIDHGDEEPLGYEFFSLTTLADVAPGEESQCVLVKVRGDSMTPTLQHGDQILINTARTDARIPALYVLRLGDTEVVVKRLQALTGKKKMLVISDNHNYQPEEWHPKDLAVIGRVVMILRGVG